MPNPIKERWAAFSEAAGVRKYVVGGIVAAVVAAMDWIEEWARQLLARWLDLRTQVGGLDMVFGFPSWIVGLTVLFFLFWIWALEYNVRLRRRLDPSIAITFDGKAPWMHPVEAETTSRSDYTKKIKTDSIYVRFKVENVTPNSVVRGCEAFLVRVSRKNDQDEYIEVSSGDSLKLRWAAKPQDKWHAAIPIPYSVNTFCDLLFVDREHNQVTVLWDVHLNINVGIFNEPGIFRFDVLVISERGGPVTKSIYLDWPGQWNQIKAWAE